MSVLVMNTQTTTNAAKPHLYKLIEVVADQLSQMQYDGRMPDTKSFNNAVSNLYDAAMDLHAAEFSQPLYTSMLYDMAMQRLPSNPSSATNAIPNH